MSETEKIREIVSELIKPGMAGVDLGYGGDSICPSAINIDMPEKYAAVGGDPQHLFGDARNLRWFNDEVIDYVFSSHLLEDFENTHTVLTEWCRVLKRGGLMILFLPHERRFKEHCRATGQVYNLNHKCEDMSLEYMQGVFAGCGIETIEAIERFDEYCFLIVGRKV